MQTPEYDIPSPGYWRDADQIMFVSATDGVAWLVYDPDRPGEPVWSRLDEAIFSPDAEPFTPPPADLQLYERTRRQFGIAA